MKRILLQFAPLAAVLSLVAFSTGCSESYGHRVIHASENQLTISDAQGVAQTTHEVAKDAEITLDGQPAVLQELDPGDPVHVKVEVRDGKEVATEIKAKTKDSESPTTTEPMPPVTDPTLPSEEPLQPTEDEPLPLPNETTTPEDPGTKTTFPDLTPDVATEQPETHPQEVEDQPAAVPKEEAPADEQTVEGKITELKEDGSQLVVTADDGELHAVMMNDETKFMLDGEAAEFEDMKVDHHVKITANKDADELVATSVEATSK